MDRRVYGHAPGAPGYAYASIKNDAHLKRPDLVTSPPVARSSGIEKTRTLRQHFHDVYLQNTVVMNENNKT